MVIEWTSLGYADEQNIHAFINAIGKQEE